jgi:HlyD family type I secretion membrane fusion protein
MDRSPVDTLIRQLRDAAARPVHEKVPDARAPLAAAATTATPITTREARGGMESMRNAALTGWLIIALFFGVFGVWASTAPLHGAVVANGVVKVEGNRKSVQHLDGGIVKALNVKDGDAVRAGDVLVVLDDHQARAEFDVLLQQFLILRATEERLKAEFNQASEMALTSEAGALATDPNFDAIWNAQVQQFQTRRVALAGQRDVIRERIAQLEAQITGGQAQQKSFAAQLQSVTLEMNSLVPLLEKGLIAKPRYLQLERSAAGLQGQVADTEASIAKARQAIAEQNLQMTQLDNDRMAEVTRDLRDTQAKLLEVIPRLANARAVLSRIEIRSPYSGRIVGLNVFSVGGVIGRGDKILDVVPDQDAMIVEAQIGVEDISDVHPDMKAELQLTAYKQRVTPTIRGTVLHVSADRLTDNRTGAPYYTALVRVDEGELDRFPGIRLYPGMPVGVMVQTVTRTALDYLVGPLTASFHKAFRQK